VIDDSSLCKGILIIKVIFGYFVCGFIVGWLVVWLVSVCGCVMNVLFWNRDVDVYVYVYAYVYVYV